MAKLHKQSKTRPALQHKKSRKYAELLDSSFNVPGTKVRIGADSLIGIIPGIGDWIGALLSSYFLIYATRMDAKPWVLIRMFVNIVVDLLIGIIPLIGDLFDVGWKANLRNAELLERLEINPEKVQSESKLLMWMLLIGLLTILVSMLLAISWVLGELWEMLF